MAWVTLCSSEEIERDKIYKRTFDGKAYLLLRGEAGLSVFDDRCSHQDMPMSAFGKLDNGEIICMAHGARFCISSGEARCKPASEGLKAYQVKEEGGDILISLNE